MNIPDIETISVVKQKIKQQFITVHPQKGENLISMYDRLGEYINKNQAKPLIQFVFGSPELRNINLTEIESCIGEKYWPITYIHGDSQTNSNIFGIQMITISGDTTCMPIYLNGRIVGSLYEDEDAEYCFLGNIQPKNKNCSRFKQAQQSFEKIKDALESVGMNLSHVIHTWFYLEKLVDWYSEFNEVRTVFYKKHGVFDNIVPVSTGIGASNVHGTSLVSNVYAVKPKHSDVYPISVPSPMQCEATNYKSSFSRATELIFPNQRQLLISGTASIDSNGNSVHIDNINSQIDQTMKVIEKIIESRSMSWSDVVRSIAYFKDIKDLQIFNDYCIKNQLPLFPVCSCQSDICRQELLFEIEMDMVKINS